jgi:hypothetical protein
LAELYTGYPLFPGENETEQLQVIMEILGVPPKRLVAECTRKKAFFDPQGKPLVVPNSRGKIRTPGAKDLAMVTKCTDQAFLSFLRRSGNRTQHNAKTYSEARSAVMRRRLHDLLRSSSSTMLVSPTLLVLPCVCMCVLGTGVFAGIRKCA